MDLMSAKKLVYRKGNKKGMKLHLIFDFNHMFYKYKFRLEKGSLRKLSYGDKDISYIYYNLRDIEQARKKYEKLGYDVYVHICLDSKTKRKDENKEYKATRENRLTEENFNDMHETAELLRSAGYDVEKAEGFEADDIIWTLVNTIPRDEAVVIYTNDSDVTVNVNTNVIVELYNSMKGSQEVTMKNFEEFMQTKFKSELFTYNQIVLYKCLVGDKADNVKGVTRFGVKAFDRLLWSMRDLISGHENLFSNYEYVKAFLNRAENLGYLSKEQLQEALDSLELVIPREVEELELKYMKSTHDTREKAYSKYEMVSLYE